MFHHVTVLREESVDGLQVKPGGIYIDCTLGGAGHSSLIAERLRGSGLLIAFDQDDAALKHAAERLAPFGGQIKLVKSNFRRLREVLESMPEVPRNKAGVPQVDGVLYDLGVSSPQLDEGERGFSYNHDAELDMRMDRETPLTAKIIVNEWSEAELARILWEYGEEKFAKRIARTIAEARVRKPIETTGELAELVKSGIPAAARRTGGHPAKRSFQALRIAVNDELGAFEDSLQQAIDCLKPGGRVAVITFHSLEDRICKTGFAKHIGTCKCPPGLPMCACGAKSTLRLVNRKPITASAEELKANNRARSAKLRIAEKLAD
ncbi:16S rRNA (cytosine(1402)-N(4))-methyltransferase RsmH [Paenibacillus thermoaerophilus]|uniref:Ribosomal RNA small subunit methyltransferase H n=1 Tax=Paenibacillus thermoaerophilus TaxID=1215385 RepID=A0ABW2UXP2_9BACL|nr:16S rRNA (cytosine(1402)-N(4))-methyltransferase RsmH [Paenibacillus thermoaerophilus]TMV19216.1 16S rRNA (cytosine(1402)-N(4))-methyltransferase RsmH [Paenibacillus thermoaerophilus]